MKTFSLAVIFTMVASAMAADPTWFLPEANNTCTGHEADGSITCELGHIGNAPLVSHQPTLFHYPRKNLQVSNCISS